MPEVGHLKGSKMSDLKGKVAIITGAGAGMGKAHAELMAERGAIIIAQDIDSGRAEATAALVRKNGGAATAIACDVADVKALT
ncbi:MAG: SDR family NAD(P)-dependent oxidoreductase, partial [Candidatus Binatia bacterium]